MSDDQPENIIPHLLRDIRERMATKEDLQSMAADLRSEAHSLRADVAADLLSTRKELSQQIVGLRRAVIEYHSAVIGHGNIIADLEARVRPVEQQLGIESH